MYVLDCAGNLLASRGNGARQSHSLPCILVPVRAWLWELCTSFPFSSDSILLCFPDWPGTRFGFQADHELHKFPWLLLRAGMTGICHSIWMHLSFSQQQHLSGNRMDSYNCHSLCKWKWHWAPPSWCSKDKKIYFWHQKCFDSSRLPYCSSENSFVRYSIFFIISR